ncbi:MAG TPA: hypothetical protein VGN41_25225 [Streptosporangiaceae bacterium]|jgi:hypothetical protein
MINTARLCDKCPARATVHVEPLDLAFCPHHWAEQPSSLKRHRHVNYGDRGVPAFQPDDADAAVSDADLAWLADQAS